MYWNNLSGQRYRNLRAFPEIPAMQSPTRSSESHVRSMNASLKRSILFNTFEKKLYIASFKRAGWKWFFKWNSFRERLIFSSMRDSELLPWNPIFSSFLTYIIKKVSKFFKFSGLSPRILSFTISHVKYTDVAQFVFLIFWHSFKRINYLTTTFSSSFW